MKFMEMNTLKITVEQDSEKAKSLLDFVNETRKGKYSKEDVLLDNITYSRIEFEGQAQEIQEIPENIDYSNILFGISN